ncbi:MAG: alkaline phosphatase [Acidobacteria bacterium SCN 69-37]|nr:MAG: alkaline phosphatase [Acidobacteria bacterium SCN 69-37]
MTQHRPSRRRFLGTSFAAGAGVAASRVWPGRAPAIVTAQSMRPLVPYGAQCGDVTDARAVIWSRTDRPARLIVEWATNERFEQRRSVQGPAALESSGFNASIDLHELPAGEQIFYRARFESLDSPGTFSEPVEGRFRTAPWMPRPLRVVWGGDVVGQGWGIDPSRGGLRMYDALRRAEPDVFVHSGDMIYADGPLQAEVRLDDGSVWRNLVTEAKSKVAETIDEFRGNFVYHLMDAQVRRFHAAVPMIAQWDDHEVVNNWFPGLRLDDDNRYQVKSASLIAARAKQAMFESVPIRRAADEAERVYRRFPYGPLLEIFVIDLRSYRQRNTHNRQTSAGGDATFLGLEQLAWLKAALRDSNATWKVIASDMPIGLVVSDREREGVPTFEAWANADGGPPSGRELELADLFAFMRRHAIRNTVWVTADVHYAAAHHYAPERAAFTDFDPFWEFVAGPMHAGTFGPNTLDATFGPEVRFNSVTRDLAPNRPPSDDLQFYGQLDIDPTTRALTVGLYDVTGRRLWTQELAPEG